MKCRILRHKFALWVIAALTCASCTQDELTDNGQGTPLPEPVPLELTAGGLQAVATPAQPTTRGTFFDSNWEGVDKVRVQVNDRPEKKEYKVEPSEDNKTARLTPARYLELHDDEFWWKSTGEVKTVMAWTKYDLNETFPLPTIWTEEDLDKFDIIGVREKNITFANRNKPLEFEHLMARITINLVSTTYLETYDEDDVSVKLASKVGGTSWSYKGEVKYFNENLQVTAAQGGDTGDIIPYKLETPTNGYYATYEALVIPQQITGRGKTIQVKVGNNIFAWEVSGPDKLSGSHQYTFNVTVKADLIDVQLVEGGKWTSAGDEPVSSKIVEQTYTADQLKPGDYFYRKSDGTWTISDGGLRAQYVDGSVRMETVLPDKNLGTCIGIVFWTPAETDPNGRNTPASLTDDEIMKADHPKCAHGLAVSLNDVSTDIVWQSSYGSVADFQGSENFNPSGHNKNSFVSIASGTDKTHNINRIYGYQNTVILRAYNTYCNANSKANHVVKPVIALDEFAKKNPAPSNSTGWFLPSVKELHILCYKDVDNVWSSSGIETRNIVNTSLSKVGGASLSDRYYWSSSEDETYSNGAWGVYFYSGLASRSGKDLNYVVRAVLAF